MPLSRHALFDTRHLFLGLLTAALFLLPACHNNGGGGGGPGPGPGGTPVEGIVTIVGSGAKPGTSAKRAPAGTRASQVIAGAVVEAHDMDDVVVATATTNSSGQYTLHLPDGSYTIGIRVGSIDNFTPLTSVVLVGDGTVRGTVESEGTATLDFQVPAASQSVSGSVRKDGVGVGGVKVKFRDRESEEVRFETDSDSSGNFNTAVLPAGSFTVGLDPDTIPSGFAAPSPKSLAVTESTVSPATLDFTLLPSISLTGVAQSTSGASPVLEVGPQGRPLRAPRPIRAALEAPPGALVIVIENGVGEIDRVTVNQDGSFTLNLRDGSYRLEFTGLGDDLVMPSPLRITVKDGLVYVESQDDAIDPDDSSLAPLAHQSSATLTGRVSLSGEGVLTRVFAKDPANGGVANFADTAADGSYSLALADGSYDILLEKDLLPPGLIPPVPVRVGVEFGSDPGTPIKESSGTANNGVVNFTLEVSAATLTGLVLDADGAGLKDVRVRALKGSDRVARAFTDVDGAFSLELPLGTLDISLNPQSLPAVLIPPPAVRVEVASVGGVVSIFGPAGEITSLDFRLEAERVPNITGTVSFDFDGDSSFEADELLGARVIVTAPDSEEVLLETTSDPVTGAFSLILGDGSFQIGLDSQSLPPGAAAPAPVRVSVSEGEVTTSDGETETVAEVNFTLAARVVTLTGVVTLDGTAASVGLLLLDSAASLLVGGARSDPQTGEYRLPLFPGSFELRVDPDTLPPGVASPTPVLLSVDAAGTIRTTSGTVTEVDMGLTRQVAILAGQVTVTRGGSSLPVEAVVQVRDPQNHAVLESLRTSSATGAYLARLLAGGWEIAIDPSSLPPGVQPPLPVTVTAAGTSVTGDGVSSNTLNFSLRDLRAGGVNISGKVYDAASGTGLRAELRLFDPRTGSVNQNFILSITTDPQNGNYTFRAVDGTYELAVLPQSIPPSAVVSEPSRFAVREGQSPSVLEENTLFFAGTTANLENDGVMNFAVRNSSAAGITIAGLVSFTQGGSPVAVVGAQIRVRDSSTERLMAEVATNAMGQYTARLPLGSYLLEVNPASLPFNVIPPSPATVLASSAGVTTNNGVAVTPDGSGRYVFNFTPAGASLSLQGAVTTSLGQPARIFVKVIDGRSQRLVAGRWTAPADGAYQAQLAPGSYQVLVDPPSLPGGALPPPAVEVTVTASAILEKSGTENDGVVNFVLKSAAQRLSGTVLDTNDVPLGCFVVAVDALTGGQVRGVPTSPATGDYQMSLPTGTYLVSIDPPSLPPGYVPPPPEGVQIVSGEDSTVNFTVTASSSCLTGTVLTATSGLAVPVLLVLEDASTGHFISSAPARFEDGSFRICAGIGSYVLKIDSRSLPSGLSVPAPEEVQVAAGAILEDNTVGSSNAENDGMVSFRITELQDLGSTVAQLTGTVTLEDDGSSSPLGAFIIVEDANSHRFISGGPTNPADGTYSLFIAEGTYDVLLDARALPPGLPVPLPVRITVDGTTITQLVQGVPVDSNVIDFTLETGGGSELQGTVTLGGSGVPCFLAAIERSSDRRVAGVPTDFSGAWSIDLPPGEFLIVIEPFSLPPGVLPAAAVEVTISGGFIAESEGTANDGVIPITLSASGAALSGLIVDDAGQQLYGFVRVVNPADRRVVAGSPTGPGQDFTASLPSGSFDVLVDPPSLPLSVAPPIPSRITVSGSSISLSTAGSGQLVSTNRLQITATRRAQAAAVTVTVEDSGGNPRPARVRVSDAAGNLILFLHVPPSPLGAEVQFAPGSFSLSIDPGSVPPGFSLPAPATVTVSGTPPLPSPSSVELVLQNEQVTLTGTVVNAVAGGTLVVLLDLYNGEGIRIRQGIPLTLIPSSNDSSYSVNVSSGTYELSLRRAAGLTGAQVILPRNVPVTITDGIVQNPDADPGTAGTQVDITVPEVMATIAGRVTLGGTGVAALEMGLRDPVGNRLVNEVLTDGAGNYQLALPAGLNLLVPDPASLSVAAGQAVPPTPLEVDVTADGDVSVSDRDDLCAGAGPAEACTGADFILQGFSAGVNAVLQGVVTTQRSSSSADSPVAGATVHLIDPATNRPRVSTITNADGHYSLIAPEGAWSAVLDPGFLNVGYPTIPPAPVRVGVFGTTINEDDTTGTGNLADDGVVNFNLVGASALVRGSVQSSNGTGIGARLVISTADHTEMPRDLAYMTFTDPNGNYFLPIGLGSYKLWVADDSLPAGFLPPGPIVFSVSGTDITESNTAGSGNTEDDGIINPVVTAGGGAVYGRVVDSSSNTVPAFVGILVPASNPNEPPRFVVGTPAEPATGNFNLTVGDGSYFLEVDPRSLPPDLQPPSRVTFTVSTSGGVTTVSYQTDAETVADGPNTRVLLTAGASSAEIRGTVKNGSGQPLGVFVALLDASSGRFIRGVPTNPSTGLYNMAVGSGAFNLSLDPLSLPPGAVPPQSVRVSVAGSTITEENTEGTDPEDDGANAANDGVVNFTSRSAGAGLAGFIRRPDGSGAFARVGIFAADASGQYTNFVNGSNSDPASGSFEIGCNEGTYRVDVDPGSVPPGYLTPEAVVISVDIPDSGPPEITVPDTATVETVGGEIRLILTLRESAGGVSGTVTAGGSAIHASVVAQIASTHQFVGESPTGPGGTYSIFLPSGTFEVSLNPYSLPPGAIPPAPQRVTVTSSVVTGVDFSLSEAGAALEGYVLLPDGTVDTDDPGINCAAIPSLAHVMPVACSVDLLIPSQDSSSPPIFLNKTFTDPATGHFLLPLSDGTFEVKLFGGSLPPGTLPPPPLTVSVSGSSVTVSGDAADCSADPSQKIIFVTGGAATLRGVVQIGTGAGAQGAACFIEVIDPTEGHFFTGMPTNPQDGSFQLSLGNRSYDVRVSPHSVPPGVLPPAPVRVSSSAGVLSVQTGEGTNYAGGVLTITLGTASRSVSGRVLDGDGNAVPAGVMAFDGAGFWRGQGHASGLDGSYTIFLTPGSYEVRVDSFSLPPGYMVPPARNVNLTDGSASDVDFTVGAAAAAIEGSVFFLSGGNPIGVPAFVEITDATSGMFLGGAQAFPDEGGEFRYHLGVAAGSFRVGVSPFSIPPGMIAPSPVSVTVSINEVSGDPAYEEEEHSSDPELADGIIDFELESAQATLNGRLVTAAGDGVFGFIRAQVAGGTHQHVGEAPTDPQGFFSLPLAAGTFEMFVDPMSLPPGFIAPPRKTLQVSGDSVSVNGEPVTGTYLLVVGQSSVSLTGRVLRDGDVPVAHAFVALLDADFHSFVNGTETSDTGTYSLPLIDGDFLVKVEPWSVPPGYSPPAPQAITVSGDTIIVDGETAGGLDLLLSQAVGSVLVEALDSFGNFIFALAEVRDESGETVIANGQIAGGPAHFNLPAGSFRVVIPGFSLPPNSVPPPPVSLSVFNDGTTVDGSGFPDDGLITLVLSQAASQITGRVLLAGSPPVPLPGVRVEAHDEEHDFTAASVFTGPDGSYSLGVPVGDYEVEIMDGLPGDAVSPGSVRVHVIGSGQTDPPGSIDIMVSRAEAILSGRIFIDGVGVEGEVIILRLVGGGGLEEVTFGDSDPQGSFQLPLPAGTFVAVPELDAPPPLFLAPLPTVLNVVDEPELGSIPLDFDFSTPSAPGAPPSKILTGSITAGGLSVDVPILILYQGNPMGLYPSEAGEYRLALPADTSRNFTVMIFPEDLPPGMTSPPPVNINVSGAGITGPGVTPGAGEFILNFNLGLAGALIHGRVTNLAGSGFPGVEIHSEITPAFDPGPSTITDGTGSYSLLFSPGEYELELGSGLPPGMVRPAIVSLSVVPDGGGGFLISVNGQPPPGGRARLPARARQRALERTAHLERRAGERRGDRHGRIGRGDVRPGE